MAEVSFNGYTASRDPAKIPNGLVWISPKGAPEVRFRVRGGNVATVLQEVIDRFHADVEDTREYSKGDDWGYAYRQIRGSTTRLSNHASGTAVDINATQHPLGTAPSANFTPAQIAAIRRLVRDFDGTVVWGGDYSGRKDGMHFEIDATLEDLAKVAERIRARKAQEQKNLEDAMPTPEDLWKADVVPNDGITGNKLNKTVTPLTYLGKLWQKVTATRDDAAATRADVTALRQEVAALTAAVAALGKAPTP